MTPIRALAVTIAAASLAAALPSHAQSGQQLYTTYCAGCHGPAGNNKNGVLSGKDWSYIKLAMDTRPEMTADLRPLYDASIITDATFMSIASYLATFSGGATSQLSMPSAFAFGTVPVGVGSSVVSKNVSSTGNAAVTITSVGNSNPAEFSIVSRTCTDGGFVYPLSSCSISVQFTPLAAGARSGTITIVSNGLGSPQTIAMSGTGQAGGPPPSGTLSMPSALGLGSSAVGVQTAGSVLTVSNIGGGSATVTGLSTNPAAEFPITGFTCASVAPGASCTVTVAFRPQAAGARSGTLTITDTGTGSPHVVTLSGTGTGATPVANKVLAIEYFHAGIGHYFLTAQADEQYGLDSGVFAGWQRTGNAFNVWDASSGGALPVFRLYTTKFASKAAHFYTTDTVEREGIRAENGGDWTYEKIAYYLPPAAGGTCPAGAVPIYRMFNNGQTGAPNHRFTTSPATYQQFTTAQGWAGEGVVFCAPQ